MLEGLAALALLFAPTPAQGAVPDRSPFAALGMEASASGQDEAFCLAVFVEVREDGYRVTSRDDDGANPRETVVAAAELPGLLRALTASPMQCDRVFVGAAGDAPDDAAPATVSMLRANGLASTSVDGERD